MKERLKSPRLRLFVALDLPDRVREGIVAWQRRACAADPALRAPAPASLHMTLVFLGYQRERDLDRIAAAALAPGPRPVGLVMAPDPIAVPARGRARLFAASGESDAAVTLQAEVSGSLQEAGLYEPESRPFWPHVTTLRVRPESRGARRPALVSRPPGPLPAPLTRPFFAVGLTLYRSVLRHQGAEYEPMAQLELPPGDGSGEET